MTLQLRNDNDYSLLPVLKSTLYPEASDNSVKLVIQYCKARKIDPMLKAIHIVRRKSKMPNGEWKMQEVLMPGIGLNRIDASRTGEYVGLSEPEFGEEITEQLGSVTVKYPKWCKITAKRLIQGKVCEFTAIEYWKENYANKKFGEIEPTDIWLKRAYGQLAKCTEAQVLRKAFPESVSHDPTFEEMEGKNYDKEEYKKPNFVDVKVYEEKKIEVLESEKVEVSQDELEQDLAIIRDSRDKDEVQKTYEEAYKKWIKTRDKEAIAKIITEANKRKAELVKAVKDFNDEIEQSQLQEDIPQ